MRKINSLLLVGVTALLLFNLTFFEKEEVDLPYIRIEIENRSLTSQIEVFPNGLLRTVYGGYNVQESSSSTIYWDDSNDEKIDYAHSRKIIDGILYEQEDAKKEERHLTISEAKEIIEMVETVKLKCKNGDGGMADGTIAHVYIDDIQYECWFQWERWGYNMELRPLAYYLVNLSRMKEMDYYKEYIPEDFFG